MSPVAVWRERVSSASKNTIFVQDQHPDVVAAVVLQQKTRLKRTLKANFIAVKIFSNLCRISVHCCGRFVTVF